MLPVPVAGPLSKRVLNHFANQSLPITAYVPADLRAVDCATCQKRFAPEDTNRFIDADGEQKHQTCPAPPYLA
jgi:hypothetical protein